MLSSCSKESSISAYAHKAHDRLKYKAISHGGHRSYRRCLTRYNCLLASKYLVSSCKPPFQDKRLKQDHKDLKMSSSFSRFSTSSISLTSVRCRLMNVFPSWLFMLHKITVYETSFLPVQRTGRKETGWTLCRSAHPSIFSARSSISTCTECWSGTSLVRTWNCS